MHLIVEEGFIYTCMTFEEGVDFASSVTVSHMELNILPSWNLKIWVCSSNSDPLGRRDTDQSTHWSGVLNF